MIPIKHIQQQHSAETGLLVLCCRAHIGTASDTEIENLLAQEQIDWKHLLLLTIQHGIRPVVFRILSRFPNNIPPPFLRRLRKQCFDIATSNIRQLKELLIITEAFKQKGITLVPYKGLLLGQYLFDDYALRESGDLDLLILPQDFPRARNLLMDMGYEDRLFYNEQFEQYFVRTNREYKLMKDTGGNERLNIELQWAPLHWLAGVPLKNNVLFTRLSTVDILSTKVQTLDNADELLVLVAHHGVADVWRKLKHVLDIAAFAKRSNGSIDMPALQQRIKENKLGGFAAAGAYLSHELLGIDTGLPVGQLSTPEQQALVAGTLQYPLLSTEKKDMQHLKRHLGMCESTADKAGFAKRYLKLWLMPNMRDMEQVRLPGWLFGLYYIVRRFRFLQGELKKK